MARFLSCRVYRVYMYIIALFAIYQAISVMYIAKNMKYNKTMLRGTKKAVPQCKSGREWIMKHCIIMSKYQGLGNDYLVLDPNKNKMELQGKKIQLLCQRGFGIGADGVLYGPIIREGKIQVRIFNPDGGEAEISGNGVRIFAKYLIDQGYVSESRFSVWTENGEYEIERLNQRGTEFKVNMGKANFSSPDIPVAGPVRDVINEPFTFHGELYNATCLSVGNPHCIIMMENVTRDAAKRLGPYVENDEHFPNRMNLQICKVVDSGNIQIEIYERGAGYTKASGTGSCAAAAAAFRMGLVDPKVVVNQPGGVIEVEIKEDGAIYMSGSVGFVADVSIAESFFS